MNQKVSDVRKACSGSFLLIGGLIFALIGLAVGWLAWDLKTGLIAASVILGVFLAASAVTFLTIDSPSAVVASLPMALGLVYNIIPDIPGPVDDSIVQLVAGALTFLMWKRRDDRFPTWAIIPLAGAGLYALIGGFIPGPFDELLVTLASVSIVVVKYRQNLEKDPDGQLPDKNAGDEPGGDQGREKITDIADDSPTYP